MVPVFRLHHDTRMNDSTTKLSVAICMSVAILALLRASSGLQAGNHGADDALLTIRPEAIRADMRFLADDLLEGRGTGTRGHEIAAAFMASQFEATGLEPAGDHGTYSQTVPLRSVRLDREHSQLSIVRGGKERSLVFGQDFYNLPDPGRADVSVQAPVVYVGFGVTAKELG